MASSTERNPGKASADGSQTSAIPSTTARCAGGQGDADVVDGTGDRGDEVSCALNRHRCRQVIGGEVGRGAAQHVGTDGHQRVVYCPIVELDCDRADRGAGIVAEASRFDRTNWMIDIRQASSEPLRFCQPPSACGSADDADSLKARNRLGGRAFTSRLAGTEVELGGGFVHWVPAARLRRADSLRINFAVPPEPAGWSYITQGQVRHGTSSAGPGASTSSTRR